MTDERGEGAWIFLSHSTKDWATVRRVRNALEELGHKPLTFFLKAITDESELDDLLRREIEARTWFLLCGSENARASRKVQDEVRMVKELPGKVYEELDLGAPMDEQLQRVDALPKRATVFLAYAAADRAIAQRVADRL